MSVLDLSESLRLITLLKVGVGSLFLEEFPLMEVWNDWVFLTSTGPMGPLGQLISSVHVLFRETVVPPPIRTGEVNLGDILEVFLSHGIIHYVSFRFTVAGSQKIRVLLRATSGTITFEAIVWRACVVPLQVVIPSEIGLVKLPNNL